MKRVGYLYNDMLDKNLIRRAIIKGLTHKQEHRGIEEVLDNIEKYVDMFYDKLANNNHKFKVGYFKTIESEQKQRLIQVPELHDHIMQHIMMQVLEPVIMKGMYKWNSGVIPNRGPVYAKRYVERVIKRYKPKYVLKLDIKKYFHNIDTNILITQLERKIKDKRFMDLIKDMLNTANQGTGVGIPIGFYSSQWLSNFYLEGLDNFIKQELKVQYYIRYMDDLVLMGNNKRQLQRIKVRLFKYMKVKLNIEPNNKHQVFPLKSRHIDFVGYLIGETSVRLRKRTFKLFKRRLRALKKNINIFLCRSYMSLRGWLTHCGKGIRYLRNNEPRWLCLKIKNYISKKDKERLNYENLCKSY